MVLLICLQPMTLISNYINTIKNIRLHKLCNLIFFLTTISSLFSCSNETAIHIIWDQKMQVAKALFIPQSMVSDIPADSIENLVKVKLKNSNASSAVFGKYTPGTNIVFEPVIPFTAGLQYEVLIRGKNKGGFLVPTQKLAAPKVLAIYPAPDTLPENLLKIYIQFSEPMQEAQSAKYIGLIKNNTDTLKDIFLDLQPELWNEDRTVITIWLDPGRIKRGLQPNLRLGNPLNEKNNYTLFVAHGWNDAQGVALANDFNKKFVAANRDSLSPVITDWIIQTPKAGSDLLLSIDLKKPLDHFLLEESLTIITASNNIIKGKWKIGLDDSHCQFIPTEPWVAGKYLLVVESKLEDLAGNNLNKPFDRDITKSKTPPVTTNYQRSFQIE